MVKISIIIPVCNVEPYLEGCLNSVLNQTLDDIEVICVDDASNDKSPEILKKYEKENKNMKCIYYKERKSAAQARKDGVLLSKGKYIMFVDSDDIIEKDGCLNAYNAIENNKTDIVQFKSKVENCANLPKERIASNQNALEPYHGIIKGDLLKACFCDGLFSLTLWNKIYNGDMVRKAFNKVIDGFFPKANDLYGAFFILAEAKSYSSINTLIYHYNFGLGMTGHNTFTMNDFKKCCASTLVLKQLIDYVDSLDYHKYKYTLVLDAIKNRLMNEQIGKWNNNVPKNLKEEALKEWKNAWSFLDDAELFGIIANKFWDNKVNVFDTLVDLFNITKTKKKIKKIALYYRCIVNGGAQRVVAQLCNMLSTKYDVVLVTDDHREIDEYYINDKVERYYIPAYQDSVKNYEGRARALWNLIDEYNIDAYINSLWLNDVAYWDALCIKAHPKNVAFLSHVHSCFGTMYQISRRTVDEYHKYYPILDGIITLSKTDQLYWSYYNDNVYYIPNPCLDYQDINRGSLNEGTKKILWVGRISEEKKPLDLIDIMYNLKEKNIDAKCYVVGDGDKALIDTLKNKIKEYELDNYISLEGFHLDTNKYYDEADLFLCTSEYEGFSLTLFEAASHGIPTVTYNLPWLEYYNIIDGWTNVPQSDTDKTSEEIIKILSDPNLWEEKSKKLYSSFNNYRDYDILSQWLEVLSSIETGKYPVIENNKELNKYIIDEIALFQTKLVNKTIKEKTAITESYTEKIEKIRKSKRYKYGNLLASIVTKAKDLIKKCLRGAKVVVKEIIPNIFNNKPKISIIMPVYNCEKYLYETLDCIQNQTLKDFEILCIDDESTDGSYDILKEYADMDSRFKIFKQKHSNAGAARNLGIEKAIGEYLLFLDSDDWFDKNLCKKAYRKAKTHNADIVIFGHKTYDSVKKKIVSKNNPKDKVGFINKVFTPIKLRDKLFQITSPCPWTKLYRRKFVINNELEYHSTPNSNDVYFTRTAFVNADRIVAMKDQLVTYRYNSSSSIQGKKDSNPLAIYEELKQIKDYLVENNLYEIYEYTLKISFMEEMVWNYKTVKSNEAREIIMNKVKEEGKKFFDVEHSTYKDDGFLKVYYRFKGVFK